MLGYALLTVIMATGVVGPRAYQIILHPELTEAQLFRTFWWAYALTALAALLIVDELRKSDTGR